MLARRLIECASLAAHSAQRNLSLLDEALAGRSLVRPRARAHPIDVREHANHVTRSYISRERERKTSLLV